MTANTPVSPPPDFSNLLWTEHHVAVATGISRQRVQQLARQGILPGFKLGRAWRFDPDAIRAWVKQASATRTSSIKGAKFMTVKKCG